MIFKKLFINKPEVYKKIKKFFAFFKKFNSLG